MLTKIKILIPILTFIIISSSIYGQTKLSKEKYNSQLDSLQNLKTELADKKVELLNEIETLQDKSTELENELTLALRDLYITKYGKEDGLNVAYGRVWIGMTEEMLRDSWGKPDKIEKNVENWGTFTQWYYGDITYFFRDGILTEGEERDSR